MPFVLPCVGSCLRADCKGDSSICLSDGGYDSGYCGDWACCSAWNCTLGGSVCNTAEILKLNKKLDTMEKISAELRELSDMIGVNIHESVMETMEFSEETKKQLDSAVSELREKLDSVAQEQKDHLEERIDRVEEKIEAKLYPEEEKALLAELRNKYAELKGKYTELAGRSTLVTRRLIDAFPKMESRLHKEMFNEMRNRIWRR